MESTQIDGCALALQAYQLEKENSQVVGDTHTSVVAVQQEVVRTSGGRILTPLQIVEQNEAQLKAVQQQQLAAQHQQQLAQQQQQQAQQVIFNPPPGEGKGGGDAFSPVSHSSPPPPLVILPQLHRNRHARAEDLCPPPTLPPQTHTVGSDSCLSAAARFWATAAFSR